MAIDLPDLDKRTYADLVEEAQGSIHLLYPDWTDHNPSDPGITLIELFAWLTEMVLYRTNRVTDRSYEVFLRILRSDPSFSLAPDQDLSRAIQETIAGVRERYRAVTADDYEAIVMAAWSPAVKRVRCLVERNLEPFTGEIRRPGHVSVILVPDLVDFDAPWDSQFDAAHQPGAALRQAVKGFLDNRRLLTTRVHVVGPTYCVVPATATLYLKEGFSRDQVVAGALAALRRYFHPLTGGADQRGWPFGRPVYTSEVYTVLDSVAGVDFVTGVDLPVADAARKIVNDDGDLVGVDLLEHELVKIDVSEGSLDVKERVGGVWL
ncbi:MAG: baseplate J/gp47 family protein [Minicystis sp.]